MMFCDFKYSDVNEEGIDILKMLDIDMDYFLKEIPIMISENSTDRVSDESYQVWDREEIIYFLEKRLGLSKDKKIKGRVVTHHNEALFYWKELIEDHKLLTPFEVIHVDSHADLGLGYPSWTFVMDSLLTMPVEKRMDMDNYSNVYEKYYEPSIGDYLLFAIAFRWITRLTYICNPAGMGDDYVWMILKDGIEPNDKIQLAHYENMKAMQINRNTKKYYETAVREPEVDFEIVSQIEEVNYDGSFDYLSFCISPNYTPASADFIIDLIREYIVED